MNILVTGAEGFVGKNLVATLENIKHGRDKTYGNIVIDEIFCFDINSKSEDLDYYSERCQYVFHLAGINRPENPQEFMAGNFGFTTVLLSALENNNNKSPILMSSSIQAELENDYGKSKKVGEDYLIDYGKKNKVDTIIFRLPNVFGKWCKPNYNSAVATFCNNIANNMPINVNNRDTLMTLVYIDDVVREFVGCLSNSKKTKSYRKIKTEHRATLGEIVDCIYGFKESRATKMLPLQKSNTLAKKLYSTYLSYLPPDKFGYDLKMNVDERGSFTEFVKTLDYGQISVNISKPKIVKGNHWHDSKNEKFLVVSGNGVIRFRKVGHEQITEYFVSGDLLKVIDIPCGYTHNIENLGESDMVTIMWANEQFDPENPDTSYLKV